MLQSEVTHVFLAHTRGGRMLKIETHFLVECSMVHDKRYEERRRSLHFQAIRLVLASGADQDAEALAKDVCQNLKTGLIEAFYLTLILDGGDSYRLRLRLRLIQSPAQIGSGAERTE